MYKYLQFIQPCALYDLLCINKDAWLTRICSHLQNNLYPVPCNLHRSLHFSKAEEFLQAF